ncbi:MAG: outer membrane protein assembly factor BamB family protein [bacterium]
MLTAMDLPMLLPVPGGNNRDRRVYCISGNSRGNQPEVIWSYTAAGDVYCVRSIPDVNHSGVDDIIASTWGNYVYCIEGANGQLIWSADITRHGMNVELLDDITGDTVPEVIVGSWNPAVIVLDGRSGAQLWRSTVGSDVWTVYPIGDVNGDGKTDVIGGSGDGYVYCFSGADGAAIWNYPTGGWVNSVRSIADVNDDMLDDVIAGNQFRESPGYVYCIEGDTVTLAVKDESSLPGFELRGNQDRIYDMSGRQVTELKPGVYFVISQKKKVALRQKIVVWQ